MGDLLINSLTLGSVYCLVVLGMVVTYRATHVVSFMQGALMVVGAMLFYSLSAGQPPLVAFLEVLALVALLSGGAYRWVFSRFAGTEQFVVVIATLAFGIVLSSVVTMVWGAFVLPVPAEVAPQAVRWFGDGWTFTTVDLLTVTLAAVVTVLLTAVLQRTRLGLRTRAVADKPLLATYLGINVMRTAVISWAIAGATAAAAGVVVALSGSFDQGYVGLIGLVAVPALIVGGLDSIRGALVGGLLVAVVQTAITTFVGGEWATIGSCVLLLVFLLFRPTGMFGSTRLERV